MRRQQTQRTLTITFALITVTSMLWVTQSFAQQIQNQGYKLPVDPAQRPKVKAMVDAINQRARELGLIAATDDEDQAAFIRRKLDSQLSEDFEKLHTINVDKIVAQSSAPSFDYKTISEATADLKTRATRIKYNVLILQVGDKGEKVRYEENSEQLPTMLPELTRLINSFLGSPVFRLNSPNDIALRVKASRDLDGIIRLSDTINKIAKRSKATPGSRQLSEKEASARP
jgi:hypothetical protein